MNAVKWMPYSVIAGVALVSLLAGFIVGWDDAWPLPFIVLPLAFAYLVYDRVRARREPAEEPPNTAR